MSGAREKLRREVFGKFKEFFNVPENKTAMNNLFELGEYPEAEEIKKADEEEVVRKLAEHIGSIEGLEAHCEDLAGVFTGRVLNQRVKKIDDAVEALLNEEEIASLLSMLPEK